MTGCEELAAPLESTCCRSRLKSRLRSSITWPSALNFSSMAAFLFLRLRFCRVDDCISCIDISQPAQRCQETLLLPLIFFLLIFLLLFY